MDTLDGRAGGGDRRRAHEGRRLLRERRESPLREDRRVDGAEARLESLGEVDRATHAVLDVAGLRGEGVGRVALRHCLVPFSPMIVGSLVRCPLLD